MFSTIIIFLVLLSLLVLVHELGHFFAARKSGVGVEEFGIGFPPRATAWKRGDTTYSLNWLPIGGFVRIKGDVADEKDDSRMNDPDSFAQKPFWKKMWIMSAGVLMNVILAMFLLSIGYMVGLPQVLDGVGDDATVRDAGVHVLSVVAGSPAGETSGLQSGDRIVAVGGEQVETQEDVISYTKARPNESFEVQVMRGEETLTFTPTAGINDVKEGYLGVELVTAGIVSYPILKSIWLGVSGALILLWQILLAFGSIIGNLFVGQGPGDTVAGPIGIAVLTGQIADLGFVYLLQFAAILSLNLAIFNLIPFPALDGGRIVFTIFEKIRGKAIRQSVEGWIHQIGFFILLLLVLVITIRDIRVYSDNILGFFQSLF